MTRRDPLTKLADELGILGRRLEAVGEELRAVRVSPATTAPPEAAPVPSPSAAPTSPPPVTTQAATTQAATAAGTPAAAPAPGQLSAPAPAPGQFPTPAPAPGPAPAAAPAPSSAGPAHPPVPPTVMAPPAPQWPGATGSGYGPPAYPPPAWPQPAPHTAAPQATPYAGPHTAAPHAAGPHAVPPMPWGGPPQPPRPTLFDRLSTPGAGSRLLAWVGGAVTLLGVVMLLVLAVQRGYLGPVPRVVGGALLGAALIGTALRLHRSEAARTGAFAVAATGFAVLYLDVVAATSLYGYLPEGVGLVAGLAVAAGGLLLATRWGSAAFAVGVVGAGAVCAPILTSGFTPLLVAFLLVLKMAATPVHLKRNWPALAVTAGVPPLLATVLAVARTEDQAVLAGIALATAVVGVAAAVLTARVRPDDRTALGLVVGSPMPALLTTAVLDRAWATGLAGVVAALVLALWVVGRRALPAQFAAGVAGVGVFALFVTTTVALDASPRAVVVLGEALVLAVLAARLRSRGSLLGAALFGGVGLVLTSAHVVPPRLLLVQQADRVDTGRLVTDLLTALVLLVLAVVLPWAAVRLDVLKRAPLPWVGIGLVALYAAAGVVLCGALAVSQTATGFVFGHSVVTVSWAVAALVLLVRGVDVRSLRVAGLVLVGAAVAKLLLFDLSALDGIARVLAFTGAGLVLLTAGTRYAKLVATRRISANS